MPTCKLSKTSSPTMVITEQIWREQQFSTERGSYIHDIYNEDKIANQIISRMFTTNKYRFCKNNSEDEMRNTVGGKEIYL